MGTQARFYCIYVGLIIFGTVMFWPICWWLSIAIDDWRGFPSVLTATVFYWILWAGIRSAKELGDEAGEAGT